MKILGLSLVSSFAFLSLAACSAGSSNEPTAIDDAAISNSPECRNQAAAAGPARSQAWVDAFLACIRQGGSQGSGGTVSSSCSIGVSNVNGVRSCSGGPNVGKTCASNDDCALLCSYDATGKTGCAATGGAAPQPQPTSDGGAVISSTCRSGVANVNGVRSCSGGPNVGKTCASDDDCALLCSYDATGKTGCGSTQSDAGGAVSSTCRSGVANVNGVRSCSGGPNVGKTCASDDDCALLCSYDAAGKTGCAAPQPAP